MKEERKVTIKLLEAEQMNTYKILAEFFARKFNKRGFDTENKKWFNNGVPKTKETVVQRKILHRKKKDNLKIRLSKFFSNLSGCFFILIG
mgnify:CR=1 FL=1